MPVLHGCWPAGALCGMRQFISLIGLLLVLAAAVLVPGCTAADRDLGTEDEGDRIADTAPGQDNRSHAKRW